MPSRTHKRKRVNKKKRVKGGGFFGSPEQLPPQQTTEYNEEGRESDSDYLPEEEFDALENSANEVAVKTPYGVNTEPKKKWWQFWGGKRTKRRCGKHTKRRGGKHSKKHTKRRK